ncbi:hypothetical protein GGH96_000680 [Coemansia sp. RSA 1972]|nr:hypothetical protein GGH96_000680 [Coemansia sp. RSA 1972]
MLGGLLSAHIIATDEEDVLGMRLDTDGTYNGELLHLARDLGYRLLSAFEASPTRVPYARRNLFGNDYDMVQEKWIHPTSSIGAGVDSIFEYMFKSYVYFGGHEYLQTFEAAYGALLQYSRDTTGGYAFYNIHMRSGEVVSSWVDSLSAFFPGLMVLAGDVDGAESAYMLYYHMWNRFRALPERFNLFAREPDIFYYLLRPEFIESTYYLYRATQDPFYLDVGEMILTDLNALMRTSCGFTAMHDVLTHTLEERMDSFVLSETFKYLYLLFDEDNPLHNLDNSFVFTTEGHVLLPLSPVRDGSAQYPRSSSFAKRKLLHSEQPPAFINPELFKIDNIRERLSKLRKSEITTKDIVMPLVRNGSAVAESALELALEFEGMCSVSSNLFLSRRHEVWKSVLASDTDINDVLDIPGDADTWLTPNTRQFSITEYLLSRATSSQAISVDASFQPKGRRGVPLFRDIQKEAPDSSGRMSLEEFYVQQREQLGKSDRLMHAAATSPSHTTNAKRRGYFPLSSEKGQQPQRRIVFTNGASQVMTDYVIVRADAAAPKYAQKSISRRSSGGDASRGEIVSEPTNNRPSASENGAANANAVYNSSTNSIRQSGFHPRWQRPPHDFCRSRRDYAGRLAYFAEMSLYRGEPFLVPKPTPLTMLHLHGSSAIYGCEEYTPREQRLFAGKVVAVRAGGGCTMSEKAIHAMNGGASALLVDVAATVEQHNYQQQSGECSAHSAAIGESGTSLSSAAQSMTGSAAHRLTDRLQHICAWRTMANDRCWPEDQYVGTGMYPELQLWSRWLRRRNRDNGSTSDDAASSHKEGTPYPISMPVVIVDQSVIDEIEGQLAEGRDIQVELL